MYLYTYTCCSLKLLWNVRKSSTNLYRPPTKKAACTAWLEERRCDFTMKVNALKPRVLVSKVRKSCLWSRTLPPVSTAATSELYAGSILTLPRLCAKKPTTQVKASLWENNGATQLDQICSSFLWSERVFTEHQCSNAATFPVYKPPATLPAMASGLWTAWRRASGQMDHQAD